MSESLEHISPESLQKQASVLKQQIETIRAQVVIKEGQLKAVNQLLQSMGSLSRPRPQGNKPEESFTLVPADSANYPMSFTDYIRNACAELGKQTAEGFTTGDVRQWLDVNVPDITFLPGTVGNTLQKMLDRGELRSLIQGRTGVPTRYALGHRFSEFHRVAT